MSEGAGNYMPLRRSHVIPGSVGLESSRLLLMVKALDSHPGVSCSKPLGDSKVDSVFHPSKVYKMGTRKFRELSGKKETTSS